MDKKIVSIIVIVLVIIVGAVYFVNKRTNTMLSPENTGKEMMKKDTSSTGGSTALPQSGRYQDYSPEAVAAAQKAGNRVVLSFSAAWCPFCKAADEAFKSRTNQIPEDVTLLKVDYDNSTDLKRRYGVTYQHTFVQINNSGDLVTKWSGGDIDLLRDSVK